MGQRMGLFHVYVEAPEKTPAAITKLATTIGKKYGVPVAELEKRLVAGRFRVKANVDRATADVYAKALADSGARVMIEDAVPTAPVPKIEREVVDEASGSVEVPFDGPASGPTARAPMQRIPKPYALAPEVATPLDRSRSGSASLPPANAARSGSSSLPPANASRTATPALGTRSGASSLPPANAMKSGPIVATGLAAAFTDEAQAQSADLGALSTDSLKLSSLDGKDTGSQQAITDYAPVDLSPSLPRPATPAPVAPEPAKKAKPKDEPVDLFAPPEAAEDAAFKVELAADEIEHRAKKMSTPPAGVPIAQPAIGSQPVSTPQLQPAKKKAATPAAGTPVTVSAAAQEVPRGRFAAGVILSILLGFIPAHLIASSRESSAYTKIDGEVAEQQNQADTPEAYEQLDAFRASKLAEKQSKHRSIAIQSMLIWAVLGGGLAYVWFRRVPWDRFGGKSPA